LYSDSFILQPLPRHPHGEDRLSDVITSGVWRPLTSVAQYQKP